MKLWSSKDEEFWTTWIHKLDSDYLFVRYNLTFLGEKKEPINVWSTVEPLADRGSHTYCSVWDFVDLQLAAVDVLSFGERAMNVLCTVGFGSFEPLDSMGYFFPRVRRYDFDLRLDILFSEFHIIKLLLEKLYFITSVSSKPRHGLFHDAFICKLVGGGFSYSKFMVVLVRS
ncbi:hypothetical protein QL285_064673 [Trifolium repens]|nr:hypothetical protein QL285_064673 [Trifolium repens]